MTWQRELGVVVGVIVGVAALAGPAGWWFGSSHWIGAAVAVGLILPAAVVAVLAGRVLVARSPTGPIIGMVLGMVLRSTAALLGGLIAFLALGGPAAPVTDRVVFWVWVLVVDLAALVAHVGVRANYRWTVGVTTRDWRRD